METKTFNGDQKIKLIQIINEGMQVTQEIETLTGGLNDTIKAVAEELEIKPGVLKKAIKIAHKAEFWQSQARSRTVGNNFGNCWQDPINICFNSESLP
jgi:hypothetical protein